MKTLQQHTSEVQLISEQIEEYSKGDQTKKLRFNHGGTNSTRKQNIDEYYWVDISGLNSVIEVNTKEKYVLVEPNVPMDELVRITLQYGLIPPVVMEFPGITVGGGINGATLESSSYKYGQFCDTCDEYEIVLGNGELITASPQEHSDIFYGISGAYGSLGLLSLIKVKLIPAAKYVHVKYCPEGNYKQILERLPNYFHKKELDYIEGIIFDKNHSVIMSGQLIDDINDLSIQTYTKAKDPWFYETPRRIADDQILYEEAIPIVDYLFRYNRGAFWVAEHVFPFFHLPNNKLTRYLLNPFINTRKLFDGLHATNQSQIFFVQDFYVPWKNAEEFLHYSEKTVDIFPIWLCPMKATKTAQKLSPHFLSGEMLVDIGIWGKTAKYVADPIGINKAFEAFSQKSGARKMLYAHAYYSEKDFWNVYDKKWYEQLRKKYSADVVFPDVWQKTHVKSEKYVLQKWKGTFKVLGETILGRHINT